MSSRVAKDRLGDYTSDNRRAAAPETTTPRPQVLLVVSSYLPNVGGLQSITASLALELAQDGYAVTVLTQRYPRRLPAAEEIAGIPVRRFFFIIPRLHFVQNGRMDLFAAGLLFLPFTLLRVLWWIWRARPVAVNLHFVGAPAFFLLIARRVLRFRLIVSVHGDDVEGLPQRSRFDAWVFRAVLRQAEVVAACSRYLLDCAETMEPRIADRGVVVYNGIEVNALAPRTPTRDSILAVGRLVPKKGFDTLLHALARCHDRAPNLRLTLLGAGPEHARLRALARELGLEERVVWGGAQSRAETLRAMVECAIVVVPSRQEAFGLTALEAMAVGKPVIATHVGGLPEVLADAEAILVAPDDPGAMARALVEMRARLEREPDLGARNRECAKRFPIARMVDAYEKIYAGWKKETAR